MTEICHQQMFLLQRNIFEMSSWLQILRWIHVKLWILDPPPPASLHFRVVQMLLFAVPAPALRGRRWRLTSADQQTSGGCNYLVRLPVEEGEADI